MSHVRWSWNSPTSRKGRGSLDVIVGPMFSGKTFAMRAKLEEASFYGYKCLYITHVNDAERVEISDGDCATHSRIADFKSKRACVVDCLKSSTLMILKDTCMKYDVIAVDEAQFFPDIVEFCRAFRDIKNLLVGALSGDFKREKFGNVAECLPLVNNIQFISTLCTRCADDAKRGESYEPEHAAFSHLKAGNDRSRTVQPGASEMYESLCGEHYMIATGGIKTTTDEEGGNQKRRSCEGSHSPPTPPRSPMDTTRDETGSGDGDAVREGFVEIVSAAKASLAAAEAAVLKAKLVLEAYDAKMRH